MSGIAEVTDASFAAEVLAAGGPVIVEYGAPWCGPCRMVGPVHEAIAAERAGQVRVVKLNTDENPQVARDYQILHVPTISLFSGGKVVAEVIGAKSKAAMLAEFEGFL